MQSKRNFLLSFFTAIALVCSISWTFGNYYDTYEKFFPYIVYLSVYTGQVLDALSNNDFLLIQMYMAIQQFVPDADVFSFGKTTFSVFYIFGFLVALNPFSKPSMHLFMATCAIVILLLDSVLIIGNVRISMLLAGAAAVVIVKLGENGSSRLIWLFYILAVLSIMNRIETGLIVLFTMLVFCLMFGLKQVSKHISRALIFGIVCLFIMHSYNYAFNHYVSIFNDTERALFDQNNQTLDLGANKTLTNYRAYVIQRALASYILDEPKLAMEDVKKLIRYSSIFEYILFDLEGFSRHYLEKIENLRYTLLSEYLPLTLIWVLMIGAVMWQTIVSHGATYRVLVLNAFIVLVPLILSIVSELDTGFISAWLILLIIGHLMYLNFKWTHNTSRLRLLNALVLVTGVCFFVTSTLPQISALKQDDMVAVEVRRIFETVSTDKEIIYVLSEKDDQLFRTRLFTASIKPEMRHISLGPFDHSRLLRNSKMLVFGDGYASIKNRMDYVVVNNLYVVSGEEVMQFFKLYLKEVHGYAFESYVMPQTDHLQLKIFSLKSTSCDSNNGLKLDNGFYEPVPNYEN